ncbi:hypothetical protein [Mycolicibacterium phlei]|uniref:hypothetical protein n=1 Tax=Mycolicibacterium phlei TaxID=1771 RepID=UPI0037C9A241
MATTASLPSGGRKVRATTAPPASQPNQKTRRARSTSGFAEETGDDRGDDRHGRTGREEHVLAHGSEYLMVTEPTGARRGDLTPIFVVSLSGPNRRNRP